MTILSAPQKSGYTAEFESASERPMKKEHLPAYSADGLRGPSLCGRWAEYATGDHSLLRRLAAATAAPETCCVRCLAKVCELVDAKCKV